MTEPLIGLHPESGVRIRRANLGDREALIELTRVVFSETGAEKGAELTPEFWDWQFARQPANRLGIWIGEYHGEIVAQVPANIVRVKWGNRELLAAWVIDLLVHPAHRNKALFIRVARFSNQEMSESGISLCLGLPNKKSLPAAVRFVSHTLVCQVPVLVLPVRWNRLLERMGIPSWAGAALGPLAAAGHRLTRFPARKTKGVVIREVPSFPEAIDDFWRRASTPHKIISVRDRKYLTWRYFGCPGRTYEVKIAEEKGTIVGYLVHRVFEKDGLKMGGIMDALVEPGRRDVLHALLASGISALREQGVDAVMSLMQPDDFYYPALRRWGFAKVPERLNPRAFNLVCRVLDAGLPKGEFCVPKNWFITLGDFDVF
jgi:hypothetical protein